jgi:integrase
MSGREAVADAFGRDLDPLAEHEAEFERLALDPFEVFLEETGPRADQTLKNYRNSFRHWRRHMGAEGRHPACPAESHVRSYVRSRAEEGVARSTVETELVHLGAAFSYWQEDAAFPHGDDFDPFALASRSSDLPEGGEREYPRVPLDDLREAVRGCGHHLDRAVMVLQLKLGLRASEVCNIRMAEANLGHGDLGDFYPDLGTHPEVEGRRGSVFVPADREGNKSERPRVLPLDDEARRALVRYLLVRPACGREGLLLSKREKVGLGRKHVARVWRENMPEEYADPDGEGARPVRSHFGRHFFTTYWDVKEDMNSELVAYMRGDAAGSRNPRGSDSMSHYLHVHYEDVEGPYRERVFKLLL